MSEDNISASPEGSTAKDNKDVPDVAGKGAIAKIAETSDSLSVPHEDWQKDYGADERGDYSMPLLGHLNELRRRLLYCILALITGFVACYGFSEFFYNQILLPVQTALPEGAEIIFIRMQGPFFLHLKIAALSSLFLVSPFIFYQIWAFVAPGLYAHEKRYIVPIAFISAVFFVAGAAFCYFVVLPFAFPFFLGYSTDVVRANLDVVEYFNFVLKLILAFGLIFEMPLFSLFLARLGVLTAPLMRRVRKYAILGIFIVAAILTPPDVLSQLLMAGPMLLLYEVSIWVAVIFGRKKTAENTSTV